VKGPNIKYYQLNSSHLTGDNFDDRGRGEQLIVVFADYLCERRRGRSALHRQLHLARGAVPAQHRLQIFQIYLKKVRK
jgi:hypothetical protein